MEERPMTTRTSLLALGSILFGALALGTVGCHRHRHRETTVVVKHDPPPPPPPTKVVVVDHHRHVHTPACGHVYDGRTWVVVKGHVHRKGCGHYYHGGRWQTVAVVRVR